MWDYIMSFFITKRLTKDEVLGLRLKMVEKIPSLEKSEASQKLLIKEREEGRERREREADMKNYAEKPMIAGVLRWNIK
jgi:hypothetical protein